MSHKYIHLDYLPGDFHVCVWPRIKDTFSTDNESWFFQQGETDHSTTTTSITFSCTASVKRITIMFDFFSECGILQCPICWLVSSTSQNEVISFALEETCIEIHWSESHISYYQTTRALQGGRFIDQLHLINGYTRRQGAQWVLPRGLFLPILLATQRV